MIVCRVCKKETERAGYQKANICRPCSAAYQKQYREKNLVRLREFYKRRHEERRKDPAWVASERERGREYWKDLRHEAIMAYGGYSCACCGETEPMFLSLDHVNNDGAAHRRSIGCSRKDSMWASSGTLIWLKKHGYPPGFQVLCMNCNCGKERNGGVCPHQRKLCEFGGRPERVIPSQAEKSEGVTTRAKARSSKRSEAHRT